MLTIAVEFRREGLTTWVLITTEFGPFSFYRVYCIEKFWIVFLYVMPSCLLRICGKRFFFQWEMLNNSKSCCYKWCYSQSANVCNFTGYNLYSPTLPDFLTLNHQTRQLLPWQGNWAEPSRSLILKFISFCLFACLFISYLGWHITPFGPTYSHTSPGTKFNYILFKFFVILVFWREYIFM